MQQTVAVFSKPWFHTLDQCALLRTLLNELLVCFALFSLGLLPFEKKSVHPNPPPYPSFQQPISANGHNHACPNNVNGNAHVDFDGNVRQPEL